MTFPEISLVDVTTIAVGMLALLGAVWALKKALGFLGDGSFEDEWQKYKNS